MMPFAALRLSPRHTAVFSQRREELRCFARLRQRFDACVLAVYFSSIMLSPAPAAICRRFRALRRARFALSRCRRRLRAAAFLRFVDSFSRREAAGAAAMPFSDYLQLFSPLRH